MIRQTYQIEIITPCFSGGAEPDQKAEIRAASIRGQLRWWFRVLGGFKSLAAKGLREQESLIFGSAAGEEGTAGALIIRVDAQNLVSHRKDGQDLGHKNFSAPAFLTFPIQSRETGGRKTNSAARGVIESGEFSITVLSRSPLISADDIKSLMVCFGNLGSLGFRSRRAMGALAFVKQPKISLQKALTHFQSPNHLIIKSFSVSSSKGAISALGKWLKSCRTHGRSGKNQAEKASPYFWAAKRDHDIGYNMPGTQEKAAYRPALGLPIIQRADGKTNNWEWNVEKGKVSGRFASPVILRPHKDAQGNWHALIIFVESMKWPEGEKVFLNGQPRKVSLDLYEAMKADDQLTPFIPL